MSEHATSQAPDIPVADLDGQSCADACRGASADRTGLPRRDADWVRAARRAKALSWAGLAWMTVEGAAGLRA